MTDTYDTHDLADLRAALGCEYCASIDEMSDAARWLRSRSMERDSLAAMAADALGCERLDGPASAVMRRIEQLRDAERDGIARLSLIQKIARILSPDAEPSPEKLLDLARKAAHAVLAGYLNEARWSLATHTLASLRAGIDALRAAARLDEGLTDVEALEHSAAALERWREAAQPEPADLPPMIVAWREDSTGWSLVRVEGDDEPTLLTIRDAGTAWRITPASHHDGHAADLPPLTLGPRYRAEALAIALVRAANPDRRVVVEGEVSP